MHIQRQDQPEIIDDFRNWYKNLLIQYFEHVCNNTDFEMSQLIIQDDVSISHTYKSPNRLENIFEFNIHLDYVATLPDGFKIRGKKKKLLPVNSRVQFELNTPLCKTISADIFNELESTIITSLFDLLKSNVHAAIETQTMSKYRSFQLIQWIMHSKQFLNGRVSERSRPFLVLFSNSIVHSIMESLFYNDVSTGERSLFEGLQMWKRSDVVSLSKMEFKTIYGSIHATIHNWLKKQKIGQEIPNASYIIKVLEVLKEWKDGKLVKTYEEHDAALYEVPSPIVFDSSSIVLILQGNRLVKMNKSTHMWKRYRIVKQFMDEDD